MKAALGNLLLLGSCGFSDGRGQIMGHQIRMWDLDDGDLATRPYKILTEHTAGIRDLCLLIQPRARRLHSSEEETKDVSTPTFYFCSCSNDGSIKTWTDSGEFISTCLVPSSPLVLSIASCLSLNDNNAPLVCSLDTAEQLCLWNVFQEVLLQRILTTCSAWTSVFIQPFLFVGYQDGSLNAFQAETQSTTSLRADDDHPPRADVDRHCPVPKSKPIVIDIDIESESKGFLQLQLRLDGENQNEKDPQILAHHFCIQHDLPEEYKSQIAAYLEAI